MAYNTQLIKKDKAGNPISQYYNPDTDQYEPVEGVSGANKVTLCDENGNQSEQLNFRPILSTLDRLTGTVIDEETRKNNEAVRQNYYQIVQDDEGAREDNEDMRQRNEADRQSYYEQVQGNETIRQDNETIREENRQTVEEWIANPEQFDGKDIEYTWRGTELGIRLVGDTEYEYVDLKGETGSIDNLTSSHIEAALGYVPQNPANDKDTTYRAGENISIVDGVISSEGGGAVESVNYKTGAVELTQSDILGNYVRNDSYSDYNIFLRNKDVVRVSATDNAQIELSYRVGWGETSEKVLIIRAANHNVSGVDIISERPNVGIVWKEDGRLPETLSGRKTYLVTLRFAYDEPIYAKCEVYDVPQ